MPDRAAIDQAVRLTRWAGYEGLTALVNGVLRNVVREGFEVKFPDRERYPEKYLSAYYSFPEWLVSKWLLRFGLDETEKLLQASNTRPAIMARVNTLRSTPRDLIEHLGAEGVEAAVSRHCGVNIELRPDVELRELPAFRKGLFTVQDPSSTLVGSIPPAGSGMRALDLCAAPGGKCTHIAERSLNGGTVVAVDSNRDRMSLLVENSRRLGLDSILFVVADGRRFGSGEYDLVLVDAPCTGTGVLARRTDLRWRLKDGDLSVLQQIQRELLQNASTLVKSGGNLLYSTCSLEPEENTEVIEHFLSERSDFSVTAITDVPAVLIGDSGCFESFPHRHALDGVFACLMKRK